MFVRFTVCNFINIILDPFITELLLVYVLQVNISTFLVHTLQQRGRNEGM